MRLFGICQGMDTVAKGCKREINFLGFIQAVSWDLRFLHSFTTGKIDQIESTGGHRISLLVIKIPLSLLLLLKDLSLFNPHYENSMTAAGMSIHFGKRSGPILFTASEGIHTLFCGFYRNLLKTLDKNTIQRVLSNLDLRTILGRVYQVLNLKM